MPSAKRSPINYAPSFGGGIFRSKSEIDGDLALLDRESVDDLLPEPVPMTSSDNVPNTDESRTNERTNVRPPEASTTSNRVQARTNERTNVPESDAVLKSTRSAPSSNERSNERTFERARVRHSFDIYRDQLVSLGDVQMTRHRQTGRKPKLGDLVQEALDDFIDHHGRSNERTNERSR